MALWETKRELPVNAETKGTEEERASLAVVVVVVVVVVVDLFISLIPSSETVLKQPKASLEVD